jgi:hypothetical protein
MKLKHLVIAAAVSMSIGANANAADRGKAYVRIKMAAYQ